MDPAAAPSAYFLYISDYTFPASKEFCSFSTCQVNAGAPWGLSLTCFLSSYSPGNYIYGITTREVTILKSTSCNSDLSPKHQT